MSQFRRPSPEEEVYEQIDQRAIEQFAFGAEDQYENLVEKELSAAKARFPFLSNATIWRFLEYMSHRDAAQADRAAAERHIPNLTEKDFWKAVYEFDPLGPGQPKISKLLKILKSGQLQSITIGKIYGHTTLKLIPYEGALPATENPSVRPSLGYAVTHGGAVSYPDGHPSEDMAFTQTSQSSFSSTFQPTQRPTIKDDDDDILRRYASLGFVIQESEHQKGTWEKTGHVLVMDMGDKRARHRHPWMILASKWPTDGEETAEGEFYYRAKEHVLRDASNEPGVFPGDNNRTPICRIEPLVDDQRPVILQLGPNFHFNPVRYGNKYHIHSKIKFGPSLVHVMEWYWDSPAKQQVCYTKAGLEYMRYDPKTMEYTYPDLSKMVFIGENGMFGTVTGRLTGFVPLAQRTGPVQGMANLSLGGGFQATHQRLISASSGF